MALTANPVPTSVQDAKLLPFHRSGKNESDMWDSYADNASSHVHHGEDALTLASMGTMDQQQQQQQDKLYPASTSGLSRNASFDSVTSHDSCTASFSTGSPVTVLPPLQYTCSGTGMDNTPSNMSTHAGGWPNSFNSSNKRSSPSGSGLQPSEEQQQQQQQESIAVDSFWIGHEQMLLSEDCEPLLPSPVGTGTLSSMLNEFPFRYDDQACASNCHDYTSVNDLECLVPSSLRTNEPSHDQQQVVKSPESVGNSNVHSTSPGQQQQSQQDFCQEFLVGGSEVYSEHNARRSDSSLLSPPAVRRRLSWSEYQVPEPQRHLATSEGLHYAGFGSQAYDHQHHFVPLGDSNAMAGAHAGLNPFRGSSCTVQDTVVGAVGSLKRPYSAMMMQPQQQPASTCSISSSAPTLSHNSYLTKFPTASSVHAAAVQVPAAPKSVISNMAPILSASHSNHQDAAALSALLYKTQGSSEMIQQLQQAQGQGTSSSDSAARQLPPPKLRRRHGTATDPQSIAARTRRERFSDRIRILQSLVPNGERLDTVSMLGHTLEYVRFLQHQVWQLYNGNDDAAVSADSESREKWKEFMDAQTVVA